MISLLLQVCISIFMFPSRLPFPAHLCICLSGSAEMQGRWLSVSMFTKHTHNHSTPSCLELLPLNESLSSRPLPWGRAWVASEAGQKGSLETTVTDGPFYFPPSRKERDPDGKLLAPHQELLLSTCKSRSSAHVGTLRRVFLTLEIAGRTCQHSTVDGFNLLEQLLSQTNTKRILITASISLSHPNIWSLCDRTQFQINS